MVTKPVLQALVLADQVYVDGSSGKKVLAGTFNRLWAKDFPTQFARTTWAFVCLTNLQDEVDIQLRYVDLRTSEVLLQTVPLKVESSDRLASAELVIEVPPFPMPHAGVYAFEVYAEDELLGYLRVSVLEMTGEAKG